MVPSLAFVGGLVVDSRRSKFHVPDPNLAITYCTYLIHYFVVLSIITMFCQGIEIHYEVINRFASLLHSSIKFGTLKDNVAVLNKVRVKFVFYCIIDFCLLFTEVK